MKKIFIAVLAVAALASCATDEIVSTPKGAAIGFGDTFVDNAVRAAVDLKKGDFDFSVYGSVVNAQGQAGMIFNNQEVAADGTYSPLQYWIASADYDFVAIAPYTGAAWTYAPAVNTVAENGTITFNNQTAAGEQDLLFAYAQSRKTPATITTAPAKVGFTFSHVLSKVAFKFANTFTDTNISLKIYNVKINNAAASGTLPVANGEDGVWAGTNDFVRAFGPVAAENVEAIGNGGYLTTEHFYLIPVEREYNITFDVDLYQAGVKLQTYNHEIPTTIALEKGKNYILNAELTPETVNPDQELYPIVFEVLDVDEWVDASPVTVPTNN